MLLWQAPGWQKPAWSRCLSWYFTKQKLLTYESDTWDFGLTGDAAPYLNHNLQLRTYEELWKRLDKRYTAMQEIQSATDRIAELRNMS